MRGKVLAISLFSLVAVALHAQVSKMDSLKQVIGSVSDAEKYDPAIKLAVAYARAEKNDLSLQWIRVANRLAYIQGDTAKIVYSTRVMCQLLNRLARFKEAEHILLQTIDIAKRNNFSEDFKVMLNNLAMSYTLQGDFVKAAKIHFHTLSLREADGENDAMAESFNNIGLIYYMIDNPTSGLKYFERALAIRRRAIDRYDMDRFYINIGLCYNEVKNYAQAFRYYDSAYLFCGKACRDQIIVECELSKGVACFKMNRILQAEKHFQKSLFYSRRTNNIRFKAENLQLLAHLLVKQKKYAAALKALRTCEHLSEVSKFRAIQLNNYMILSELFLNIKNHQKQVRYQTKYILLNDSIRGEKFLQNLVVAQVDFDQRSNRSKMIFGLNIITLRNQIIENQRQITVYIAAFMVVLFVLAFVFYHNIRTKKDQRKHLENDVRIRTANMESIVSSMERELNSKLVLDNKAMVDLNTLLNSMDGLLQVYKQNRLVPELKCSLCVLTSTVQNARRKI